MLLLTSEAIYIPSKSKVILNNNVKMYDESDSLECQHLILYEKEYKNFNASGDVRFYKNNQIIKSGYMEYIEHPNMNSTKINLYENAEIIDSNRVVLGDTLYINYKDSLIHDMSIISNAEVVNYRYAKYSKNKNYQKLEDNISSKKMFVNFKKLR